MISFPTQVLIRFIRLKIGFTRLKIYSLIKTDRYACVRVSKVG